VTTARPTEQSFAKSAETSADETTEEAAEVDGAETEEEGEEGDETEELGQTPMDAALGDEGDTADGSEHDELDASLISPQEEGHQQTDEGIQCPPCSPISGGRHKRGRTDDSEQCNTEIIDEQWKRAREDDEAAVDEVEAATEQADQHTATTESTAAPIPAPATVHALLPFKAALLHPFPTSHTHLHSSGGSGGLTPYRGLLRPFPTAQHSHSPLRIAQPAL